jgi:hypothetical protein
VTPPALVSLHVGHHALTLASAATVLALVIVAVLTAVVLERRAVPSAPLPTNTKENPT